MARAFTFSRNRKLCIQTSRLSEQMVKCFRGELIKFGEQKWEDLFLYCTKDIVFSLCFILRKACIYQAV